MTKTIFWTGAVLAVLAHPGLAQNAQPEVIVETCLSAMARMAKVQVTFHHCPG